MSSLGNQIVICFKMNCVMAILALEFEQFNLGLVAEKDSSYSISL